MSGLFLGYSLHHAGSLTVKLPDHLKKLVRARDRNRGMSWHDTENVLEVTTPHAFVQAVGYLKYALRERGGVYFRGQNKLYPGLVPALFRGIKKIQAKDGREKAIVGDFVVGVLRIEMHRARAWLGSGELTSTHHLFPPPLYDAGYNKFLFYAPPGNRMIGAIHHVGA